MGEYGLKDLMAISQTSERAIRQLFKTNSELRELKKEHKVSKNNRVFYDDVIYNWFLEHYKDKNSQMIENVLPPQDILPQKRENPDNVAPLIEENSRLTAELEEIKGKYAALQADFEKAEGERVELLRQNGLKTEEISHILLLLSQEKAEKQALLPAPRRSIGEKIKGLFKRKEDN